MATEPFNPLAVARDLEAAGVVREQAEALRQAVSADRGELVTRGELYRALWIQGAALIGAQIAIAGIIVTLLSR